MKNNWKKSLKNTNGITLIALVITIIVLLILAGVSLSMVLNQDGIFSRAEQATDKYGQAKARETLEIAFGTLQAEKYEERLSVERLDTRITEEINKMGGTEIGEDKSQVVVDGYIFLVDRTIPKIVEELGPANGVIVTAKITQNGDWQNPVATVTGTITKYGGGSVVSTTVSATNGVTIPADFPKTGGSYTISNITTDTEITITTTDSDGKTATKTIPVKLVRDTTPPVISGQSATAKMMKITISARATDSESGLKSFTYKIEPNTIKDGKSTGNLTSGTPIEVEATAVGNYTVTFTATDNANNTSTAIAGPVQAKDTISVEDAKRLVNESNIRDYIGTKVDYNSPEGGAWRIFYYDGAEGYFGRANTVYLKRDYDSEKGVYPYGTWKNITPSTTAVNYMRQMNPKWRDSDYSEINLNNERMSAGFYEQTNYGSYKNSTYSSYAIGSPSVEMYMKAFNVWKTGNKDADNLVCKIGNANGYAVGANGNYDAKSGYETAENTIEAGPGNIFMEPESFSWWLSSPSACTSSKLLFIYGFKSYVGYRESSDPVASPVVPLDL